MNVLIAGGAGFIGSAFARLVRRERPDWRLVIFDKLTYAGNLQNLQEIDGQYAFVRGDIADAAAVREALRQSESTAVVNFAAESHVDRSILGAREFVVTDVLGAATLLAEARAAGLTRYLHVSTDEVYGSIPQGTWTETAPLLPNSPYAASKAGGDLQVRAAFHTFGQPVLVTRGSNTYGPYHFPEKIIPLFITNLLEGKRVPLYGDGRQKRDWLYVDDHARGILAVLEHGTPGEIYNLGSEEETENIELTHLLLRALEKGKEWMEFVPDRPGHDRRYALDSSKAHALGWRPTVSLADGLTQTLAWYKEHVDWWKPLKSGAYREYYQRQYVERGRDVSGTGFASSPTAPEGANAHVPMSNPAADAALGIKN